MAEMFDNTIKKDRVLLAAVDTGSYDVELSLDELEELTETAGGEVIARVTQKRPSFDSGTCIGSGRLEEMAEICRNENIDRIVFDCELTATQIRNIEDVCGVFTIDRTMLILDIFAQRATTHEGRLQVEIAQNKYRLPRLAGMGTNMSRLGGGIGTRGPGESKLTSRSFLSLTNSLRPAAYILSLKLFGTSFLNFSAPSMPFSVSR